VFDYPTPALLAQQICEQFSAPGALSANGSPASGGGRRLAERRYIVSADAAGLADASPIPHAMPSHSLGGLYEQAAQTGKINEIMKLIAGLAGFRPTFSAPSELAHMPHPVPVSRGPAEPALICIPSFVGRSGNQEYVRFAREFHGTRALSAISAPGFIGGEPLAASVDALIGVHTENMRRSVNGEPFALVGYSSGGLLAHSLAAHLESIGMAPAALVLIDTDPLDKEKMAEGYYWPMISDQLLADIKQQEDPGEDAWITAMTHYLLLDWTDLRPTAIPTLMVRPWDYVAIHGDGQDDFSWPFSSNVTVVTVPGAHFTMMAEHAATTARAVSDWLTSLRQSES
jgi:thioesterase domain-containing protein